MWMCDCIVTGQRSARVPEAGPGAVAVSQAAPLGEAHLEAPDGRRGGLRAAAMGRVRQERARAPAAGELAVGQLLLPVGATSPGAQGALVPLPQSREAARGVRLGRLRRMLEGTRIRIVELHS